MVMLFHMNSFDIEKVLCRSNYSFISICIPQPKLKLESISLVHSISTHRKDFKHPRKISMRIKSKSVLIRDGSV